MATTNFSRHVSYEQVKQMLDFMEGHADFATDDLGVSQARKYTRALWGELSTGLNGCQGGTIKSVDEWRKYWSDFRHKLRNKVWLAKRRREAEGTALPLNKLERKAMVILEPYFEKKERREEQRRVQKEKKTKRVKRSSSCSATSSSDSSDESLSGFTDSDSDSSSSSSDSPIIINTVYPSWMARVEQKRAEAELARARADEVYARSAAQTAHAAQAQADALSCLARATAAQADALARIATTLDRPSHRLIDF